MNHPIEAVFLDIDGTLYEDGRIADGVIDAIARLHEKQIVVSLCTGRSILHTLEMQNQLSIPYGVYFNGSLAMHGEQTIYSAPFETETVRRIAGYSQEADIPVIFHSDEETFVLDTIPTHHLPLLKSYDFPPLHQVDIAEILKSSTKIYQVNAFVTPQWDSQLQMALPECLIYRWAETAIDLQKRSNDKSLGATALLKQLQISPQNALHIGDGGNDIGMFNTMGYSVAMGNATESVKKHARQTTSSVHEYGVWNALKQLGLI